MAACAAGTIPITPWLRLMPEAANHRGLSCSGCGVMYQAVLGSAWPGRAFPHVPQVLPQPSHRHCNAHGSLQLSTITQSSVSSQGSGTSGSTCILSPSCCNTF